MSNRLPIVLSLVNLVLLMVLLLRYTGASSSNDVVGDLRCRAFRVVDEAGRVRASIDVLPATTFKLTGKQYPETVLFRLIDAKGRPEVKIGASVEGGGLGFVGSGDDTQVKLEANGSDTSLTLKNKDGKEQTLRP